MAEFYQVGMRRNKDGKDEIDLDNLNFSLRRSFDLHKHVDVAENAHGTTGGLIATNQANAPGKNFELICKTLGKIGPAAGSHATDWPTTDNIADGEMKLWHNEAVGWRLYFRNGDILPYLDLTV